MQKSVCLTPLEFLQEFLKDMPSKQPIEEDTRFVMPSAYRWVPTENSISSQPLTSSRVQRKKILQKLYEYTDRNVIAYYSGFLTEPSVEGVEVEADDKQGFVECVQKMDVQKGLDLILHIPGGDLAAIESIICYLNQLFGGNIRAIIPLHVKSTGTLIACACSSLLLGKQSSISPLDPQVRGISAGTLIKELERASKEIEANEFAKYVWQPILKQVTPSLVEQCQSEIEKSTELLRWSLENGMFKGLPYEEKNATVDRCIGRLARIHDYHVHYQECIDLGLAVEMMEDDQNLQDLILTAHQCFVHTLANTSTYKILENHDGYALVNRRKD